MYILYIHVLYTYTCINNALAYCPFKQWAYCPIGTLGLTRWLPINIFFYLPHLVLLIIQTDYCANMCAVTECSC